MHRGLITNDCGHSHIATGYHGLFQESANGDGKCVPETNPGKHHTFTIIIQNLVRSNDGCNNISVHMHCWGNRYKSMLFMTHAHTHNHTIWRR